MDPGRPQQRVTFLPVSRGANEQAPTETRWQERAVERSLRGARARAVSKSERFIAVATELLRQTGRTDFTVQEIIERSRMSLRSFYQHFSGKDELLLAVLEEALLRYVTGLREAVAAEPDPGQRLRHYVLGFYSHVEGEDLPESRALSGFFVQLAETNPSELARMLAPQVALLREIVHCGVDAGRFRDDIPSEQLVILVTQTLMAAIHMRLLGVYLAGSPLSGEQLLAYIAAGVGPPACEAGRGDGRGPGRSPARRTAGR